MEVHPHYTQSNNFKMKTREITLYSIILGAFVILLLWGCPQYNVYRQRKSGEASLARAQYSKRVAIAEAEAKMESSEMLAKADTIRAHGIATANQIIGKSLTQEYLQWYWTDGLHNNPNANQYIYIPSGSLGMPVTEATRFNKPEEKK